jgi:phosphoglycolate phosphatase
MESYRDMVGWGIGRLAELALPEESRSEVDAGELAEEMRRAYMSHPLESSTPFEGIPELISSLHSVGVPMAVLSNKVHELTNRLIKKTWGEDVFSTVYGARDDLPMKPHPEAAQRIAAELRMKPYEMIFVGDSAIDMETAQVAGMYPVGVSWGYREVEELWMHGAAMVVSSPDEIPPLIFGGASAQQATE